MHIGYIGLGKMGRNMVERLHSKGYTLTAYDPDEHARGAVSGTNATTVDSLSALVTALPTPRTVWLMVPHTAVESVLNELLPLLDPNDTVIEGGNSPYKETIRRSALFEKKDIHFLDAGVSGGPGGAKNGACIMVGGTQAVYDTCATLFADLSVPNGSLYVGPSGSGHFVKMVHNGIEYGMMQAIAEGFDVLKNAPFETPLPLSDIASLYNHGSVITSRLVGWLASGYGKHGSELEDISGRASASGEGLWTVETAKELGIPVTVIADSLTAREKSQRTPNYQGKVVSVLRNEFGGHDVTKKTS